VKHSVTEGILSATSSGSTAGGKRTVNECIKGDCGAARIGSGTDFQGTTKTINALVEVCICHIPAKKLERGLVIVESNLEFEEILSSTDRYGHVKGSV
jgi:hypothetical protein